MPATEPSRREPRRPAFPRRVLCVALFAALVPLLALVVLSTVSASVSRAVLIVTTVATLLGIGVLLLSLRAWLEPLGVATARLDQYLDVGTLEIGGPYPRGELGELLRDIDAVFRRLDDARVAAMHAANTDDLTGAATRQATLDRLYDLTRDRSAGPPALVIALLDVDHFKAVNDEHGHAAGDFVLSHLVELLRGIDRHRVIGRWGGDEFLLVAAATPAQAARSLDEVRRRLAADTRAELGTAVTFSAGVTSLEDARHLRVALGTADRALYAAKRSGRDAVVGGRAPSSIERGAWGGSTWAVPADQ